MEAGALPEGGAAEELRLLRERIKWFMHRESEKEGGCSVGTLWVRFKEFV